MPYLYIIFAFIKFLLTEDELFIYGIVFNSIRRRVSFLLEKKRMKNEKYTTDPIFHIMWASSYIYSHAIIILKYIWNLEMNVVWAVGSGQKWKHTK